MKKLSVILVLSLIAISAVLAAVNVDTLIIVPYDGISGIPVGSNYYDSDTSGTWAYGSPEGEKCSKENDSSTASRSNYTDTEMLGIIMFLKSGDGNSNNVQMDGKITVTVTCANGFYLQSQSNPNYKRPFEITLFDSWNKTGAKGHKVSESEPTFTVELNNVTGSDWNNKQIHFDVCIRLPGTVDYTTNECTKDGIIYPLSVLEDYSAIVTFNVKYEPDKGYGNTIESTVTLPFSGFYESNEDTKYKNGAVSMSIVLNSDAYNIDIKNKIGQTVSLGSIYYTMMVGKDTSSTPYNTAIFLSSSANAEDKTATKFALVKDDLKATDAHTALNSIGFKIKVTSYEDTSSSVTFDGTTYFDKSLAPSKISTVSGSPGDRKKATQTLTSTDYIIPNLYTEYMASGNRSYFYYSGSMELELDDNVITMLEGRYTETVYVHVMSYK